MSGLDVDVSATDYAGHSAAREHAPVMNADASDLLAALREIAAIGDREELSIHDSQVKRYSRQAVDIARAAIAKAEGRS